MLKNEYVVKNSVALLYITRPNGIKGKVIIDTKHLELVKANGPWSIKLERDKTYISNHKHKFLHSLILDNDSSSRIVHLNGNNFDNRESNLKYEKELPKTFSYKVIGSMAIIDVIYKGQSKKCLIDKEDLPKVINTAPLYIANDKNRIYVKVENRSVSIHSIILGLDDNRLRIKHLNGNRLDNRKNNLVVLGKQMTNYYETIGDTVVMHVYNKAGELFKVTIDSEDLPKILGCYSWNASRDKNNGKIYIIGHAPIDTPPYKKRIMLHRYIINAPEGYIVRHKDEDTLNNRKENIYVLHNSPYRLSEEEKLAKIQNKAKQKRKYLKQNISGHRCVYRNDKMNKWYIVIKGLFLGSYDNLEEAIKISKQRRIDLKSYSTYQLKQPEIIEQLKLKGII